MVDQRLASLNEKITGGVFANASLVPLLFDEIPIPAEYSPKTRFESEQLHEVQAPRPIVLKTIEILDDDLRSRCLDLFSQFKQDGQYERLDTVVSEATRILEDKLRRLSQAPSDLSGLDLAEYAFGRNPKLVVSENSAEQQAAHLMFRGVFGFIRNAVHHRLVANLVPERVIQIVATIDYLISVAEHARNMTVTDNAGG